MAGLKEKKYIEAKDNAGVAAEESGYVRHRVEAKTVGVDSTLAVFNRQIKIAREEANNYPQ